MIEFEWISYKNFLSVGNVPIKLDLNKNRATLIIGKNGHGKSILLDALCYVLFGKDFRNINKGQIVNSINNRDMLVEISFLVNGIRYHIKRGLKPAVFEIYKNNVLESQSSDIRDYQAKIDKHILKMNFKSFCQIVILGKAEYEPFMKLKPMDRRAVVEEILDIELYSRMLAILKKWIETNYDNLKDIDHEIEVIEANISSHKEKVQSLRQNSEEIIEFKLEKKAEHEEEIVKLLSEKSFEQETHDLIKLDMHKFDITSLNKKEKDWSVLSDKLAEKAKRLDKDIIFFGDNETCPSCSQDISKDVREETIRIKDEELAKITSAILKIEDKLDKVRDDIVLYHSFNKKLTPILNSISNKETQIHHLKQYNEDIDREIEKLRQRTENIANTESVSLQLNTNLLDKHSMKEELINNKMTYDTIASILSDSGVKALIIKQYIPLINKLLLKYFKLMNFSDKFELDENFNEIVRTRFKENFTYYSFSEGQKFRIDIALLFTWREIAKIRNSASTNLLILDETFDGSLDSDGTDDFMALLFNLTDKQNTIIISHNVDQLQDKFDNVITFKLEKNFTKMIKKEAA